MAAYDAVAVPSVCLETGPLVALEAFGAGRPVLGSRLGGLTELVTNGVDGLLIEAGSDQAWAKALADLAADRSGLLALAAGVRPPRTMDDCAAEMAALYARLV